jgi:hypothetical protein
MPRACNVCQHDRRGEIDRALAAGQSLREMSALFRVSEDSLARHRDAHIPKAVQKAQEAEEVAHGLDVVAQLKAINGVTMQILEEARQQRNPDIALKAIDRIQRQIELQAKLLGDLDERPQVNVVLSPEWLSLRLVIVQALADHPEAQRAVVGALSAKGGMS